MNKQTEKCKHCEGSEEFEFETFDSVSGYEISLEKCICVAYV